LIVAPVSCGLMNFDSLLFLRASASGARRCSFGSCPSTIDVHFFPLAVRSGLFWDNKGPPLSTRLLSVAHLSIMARSFWGIYRKCTLPFASPLPLERLGCINVTLGLCPSQTGFRLLFLIDDPFYVMAPPGERSPCPPPQELCSHSRSSRCLEGPFGAEDVFMVG